MAVTKKTSGKVKRFLLFAYANYYPGGGWGDFIASYDSADVAIAESKKLAFDYIEVIDLETGEDIL